jgi:transcription termination/antitermination protein NusG
MVARTARDETPIQRGIQDYRESLRTGHDADRRDRFRHTDAVGSIEVKMEGEPTEKLTHIFALRTTANREDQVMDFITSNISRKHMEVYAVVRPHGMRSYIFLEASKRTDAEAAAYNVPYARGLLPKEVDYKEIEHMLEQVKRDVNIKKNDIAEIISGPFKREKCKVTRVDKTKEEVIVELLEAAVPIPITLKFDAIKVIRRDSDEPIADSDMDDGDD